MTPTKNLLYVTSHLSYESPPDVSLNKASQLEYFFIEITNPTKRNINVSCLYKHPIIDVSDFNNS